MGFDADGFRILLRESFDKAVLAGSVAKRFAIQMGSFTSRSKRCQP